MSVWPTISQGTPSPRNEIVYNVEPFRAAVRQGDWKLVWRTLLPPSVELYNIRQDPAEKNNLAGAHPEKVAVLQQRIKELSAQMVKPLFLEVEFKAMLQRIGLPPALPGEDFVFNEER
jgi:arylsulfatase A-like enzyme